MNKKIVLLGLILSSLFVPLIVLFLLKNSYSNVVKSSFISLFIISCGGFFICILNFFLKRRKFGKIEYFISLKKEGNHNFSSDFMPLIMSFMLATVYRNIYVIGLFLLLTMISFYLYIIHSRKNNFIANEGIIFNGFFIKWYEISNIKVNNSEITINFKYREINKLRNRIINCYAKTNDINKVESFINSKTLHN